MSSPLAAALGLSGVIGLASALLIVIWPRRLTAEEWMFHRRALSAVQGGASAPALGVLRLPSSGGWLSKVLSELVPAPDADVSLLQILGRAVPAERIARHLGTIAAGAALAGLAATLLVALLTRTPWLAAAAPAVAVLAALAAPAAQLLSWKLGAKSIRSAVQRRLPRVLTGARVLLEAGAVTPEGALAAAVAAYEDHASGLLREALRLKQVRRLDLEAALDEVAEQYADDEIHKLADAFRVGHRYGTGMSVLLADVCRRMRQAWHARYRERITRAPVLMLLPALVFFVIPLLGLVMFLIFTPLLGTLGQL